MKSEIARLVSVALFAALLGLPRAAGAAEDRLYDGRTTMIEQSPSVGEFDGSLQLRISPGGIVSGFYRPDSDARFISVTGGLAGDRLWLEIGSITSQPWRFSGTFRAGTIDAVSSGYLLDDGRVTGVDLKGTLKGH